MIKKIEKNINLYIILCLVVLLLILVIGVFAFYIGPIGIPLQEGTLSVDEIEIMLIIETIIITVITIGYYYKRKKGV